MVTASRTNNVWTIVTIPEPKTNPNPNPNRNFNPKSKPNAITAAIVARKEQTVMWTRHVTRRPSCQASASRRNYNRLLICTARCKHNHCL